MGTLQRLFWRSTFNPLIVFVAILLAFFAFRASAAERVVLIALGVVLVAHRGAPQARRRFSD
ncbi:hypothetical protein QEV11_00095 [Trueperella pyogenes]|uniref:hypothetical protein n=1 Tax=Trueperella pyogenes TaxID=1661 RepID=UPI0032448665